jgi:dTDP-4-dehydrorhamnose 3,5-epimerase
MQVHNTALPGVLVLEPRTFQDERGTFSETWNARTFATATGRQVQFVQDNHSASSPWVVRGLHYQIQSAQGKLVRVSAGAIYDVAVDLRRGSPNFGRWVAQELSTINGLQLWIPAGFAHGYMSLAKGATVQYKATDFYAPNHERTLLWNDPTIAITWPHNAPTLSSKDEQGLPLEQADVYE